ncbi:MAG: hypothetical protein JSR73_11415 [Proteobacteria bacterium]|nr:hypothetical protein [Pseudomonadota bacterium]
MAIEVGARPRAPSATAPLSGRARAALSQHQRRVAVLQRDLQSADRVLAGALSACDGSSQADMLGGYLEAVQELRVSLERLEGFLLQRLAGRAADEEPPDVLAAVAARDERG